MTCSRDAASQTRCTRSNHDGEEILRGSRAARRRGLVFANSWTSISSTGTATIRSASRGHSRRSTSAWPRSSRTCAATSCAWSPPTTATIPPTPSTDHSREYVPLLVGGPRVRGGAGSRHAAHVRRRQGHDRRAVRPQGASERRVLPARDPGMSPRSRNARRERHGRRSGRAPRRPAAPAARGGGGAAPRLRAVLALRRQRRAAHAQRPHRPRMQRREFVVRSVGVRRTHGAVERRDRGRARVHRRGRDGRTGGCGIPCGACRQVLHEFAPDLWVYWRDVRGRIIGRKLEELLAEPFRFADAVAHGADACAAGAKRRAVASRRSNGRRGAPPRVSPRRRDGAAGS